MVTRVTMAKVAKPRRGQICHEQTARQTASDGSGHPNKVENVMINDETERARLGASPRHGPTAASFSARRDPS
jgi:hypothetical protein